MGQEVAHAPEQQSGNFLAAILKAATDPAIDATKVATMAELAVKLQDRERETEFNRAKNAAIMDMPVITKEGIITIPAKDGKPARTQGRFARFEDIYRVVRPILQVNNLALAFDVAERPSGGVTVRPILSHANGYTERGEAMPLPADTSGSKNAAQAVGSSVQYGKRYTMCAMLNIVTEGMDDDGRGGAPNVSLPFEREQVVLNDAKQAHEDGRYLEWFGGQSPKDRAWLIQSGQHEGFGGQVTLALPKSEPKPEPAQQQAKSAAKPTNNREQRARDWVDWFKGELAKCGDVPTITALQDDNQSTITTLQSSFPALYAELDRAVNDRLASL
jgi:hypothetical protein